MKPAWRVAVFNSPAMKAAPEPSPWTPATLLAEAKRTEQQVHQKRVQKACRLLAETDQPGKVIALQVGMDDPNYFSRWFKKLIGVAPTAFRLHGFAAPRKR